MVGVRARLHSAGCSTPRPIRSPSARSAQHRLVRARLRDRPGGRLPAARLRWRGAPARTGASSATASSSSPIAALIGGRLYHVIDQWAAVRRTIRSRSSCRRTPGSASTAGSSPARSRAWWYARRRGVSFARWADIVAPALFVMQAIGRWGNYFNQELYGPPTTLPWGIPIDCAHRLAVYACARVPRGDDALPPAVPVRVDLGHPRRAVPHLARVPAPRRGCGPATCCSVFFIWYGATRFLLETLRERQLDVLRRPDRPDRVARVHRRRHRRAPLSASPGHDRTAAGASRRGDLGRDRTPTGGRSRSTSRGRMPGPVGRLDRRADAGDARDRRSRAPTTTAATMTATTSRRGRRRRGERPTPTRAHPATVTTPPRAGAPHPA